MQQILGSTSLPSPPMEPFASTAPAAVYSTAAVSRQARQTAHKFPCLPRSKCGRAMFRRLNSSCYCLVFCRLTKIHEETKLFNPFGQIGMFCGLLPTGSRSTACSRSISTARITYVAVFFLPVIFDEMSRGLMHERPARLNIVYKTGTQR